MSLRFFSLCNTFRPLVRQPRSALHLFLLLLCLPVAAVAAEAGRITVESVRVEGNRRIEVDAIKAAISEKPGGLFDRRKIDADIRAIMKLGFFSDVVVQLEGTNDAPVLVYKVTEKPAVHETRIEGNEEISKDDFKDLTDIKPFSILDVQAVRRNVKKIQDKYVEKGYYLAEVSYRLEPQPDNQVTVVFAINEHAKVQVKEIRFLGNRRVAREELTAVMQTQEGGYLSFLTSSGTYKEEAFQRDLQAIQAVYRDQGFMNIRVDKPSVSLSPDKRFIYITIRLDEGDQFRIGKIDFSGELLHPKEEVARSVTSKIGELVAFSRIGRDLYAVADLYRDEGYAYVNVSPLTNVDAKNKTVDLTFDVQPGQKVSFERIEVTGNTRTRDKVIRRELRIYEGELTNGTGLRNSKQRVTALGFFETVEITTRKGSADDKMIATVEVKEKPTGTFQLGAGFSSYENFILTGQISQNNFLGWGQSLTLQIQWSSVRQLGQIQFVEPYFFDTKWTFAFDLYATEGAYTNFTRRALGGSLTWGYELSGLSDWMPWTSKLEDWRLFATYTNEFVRVSPSLSLNDVPLSNEFRSGTTSALRFSLQIDKRNNRLFPTSGHYQSIGAEFAAPVLAPTGIFGQSVNLFTRYTIDSRYYLPLPFGFVGRAKLAAGYIRDWDSSHPVPASELYYLGGSNSIRGYRQLTISPVVYTGSPGASALSPVTVGGDKQLVANLELEFPVPGLEKLGFRGVVFSDWGNVWPTPGRGTNRPVPLDMYKSVGFGFRWFSPIGPLRFEWGIPLNKRPEDQAVDFQFTVGNSF